MRKTAREREIDRERERELVSLIHNPEDWHWFVHNSIGTMVVVRSTLRPWRGAVSLTLALEQESTVLSSVKWSVQVGVLWAWT